MNLPRAGDSNGIARMLLLEDDEDHAALILETLSDSGLEGFVRHVQTREQALTVLRSPDGRPDVLLLDLHLGHESGLDILAELRADPELCHLPVVVLTTSNAEHDRERAYALRANSYLVKPIDHEEFQRVISEAGGYWARLNSPPPRDRTLPKSE